MISRKDKAKGKQGQTPTTSSAPSTPTLEEQIKAQVEAALAAKASESNATPKSETGSTGEPAPKSSVNGKHGTALTSEQVDAFIKGLGKETQKLQEEIRGVKETVDKIVSNHEPRLADCEKRIAALEGIRPAPVQPKIEARPRPQLECRTTAMIADRGRAPMEKLLSEFDDITFFMLTMSGR